MNGKQCEHTVCAAGAILDEHKVLIIGSQAMHASVKHTIPKAERSIETDIASFQDKNGSMADLLDGSIGEFSLFQETFGYVCTRRDCQNGNASDRMEKQAGAIQNTRH